MQEYSTNANLIVIPFKSSSVDDQLYFFAPTKFRNGVIMSFCNATPKTETYALLRRSPFERMSFIDRLLCTLYGDHWQWVIMWLNRSSCFDDANVHSKVFIEIVHPSTSSTKRRDQLLFFSSNNSNHRPTNAQSVLHSTLHLYI